MKIKKLIKIFEKCLKNYQKGYDEKYERFDIISNNLELGICFHCSKNLGTFEVYRLFNNGYYSKYVLMMKDIYLNYHILIMTYYQELIG